MNKTDDAAEPQARRLFLACWPDGSVRAQLARLLPARGRDVGKPTDQQNLHLTLVFLGSVDGERLACLEEMAGGVAARACSLHLDAIGFWKRSQILWVGTSRVPQSLAGLVSALNGGIKRCGFAPETRPFKVHVTLARKVRRAPVQPVTADIDWPIRSFELVESQLTAAGARYTVMRSWSLR